MKCLIVIAAVLFTASPVVVVGSHTGDTSSPLPGRAGAVTHDRLTHQGALLFGLEALLRKRFGHRNVCTWDKDPRSRWNFTDACAQLSDFPRYRYTFADPGETSLHPAAVYDRYLTFGNYPEPVLVQGHLVLCGARPRRFLVDYASAQALTLGCLSGEPAHFQWTDVYLEDEGDGIGTIELRSVKVGPTTWAVDWNYLCATNGLPERKGQLHVTLRKEGTRAKATLGGSGTAFSGEHIFSSAWSGIWSVHVVVAAPIRGTANCKWRLWVVR